MVKNPTKWIPANQSGTVVTTNDSVTRKTQDGTIRITQSSITRTLQPNIVTKKIPQVWVEA